MAVPTSTLTNLFTDLSRFCQNEEYEKAIRVTNKSMYKFDYYGNNVIIVNFLIYDVH